MINKVEINPTLLATQWIILFLQRISAIYDVNADEMMIFCLKTIFNVIQYSPASLNMNTFCRYVVERVPFSMQNASAECYAGHIKWDSLCGLAFSSII